MQATYEVHVYHDSTWLQSKLSARTLVPPNEFTTITVAGTSIVELPVFVLSEQYDSHDGQSIRFTHF